MSRAIVKKYVLVDEREYESDRLKGKFEASKRSLPNPFQNPDVRAAKRARNDLYDVATDRSVPADEAERMIERALDRYRQMFKTATGGKKIRGFADKVVRDRGEVGKAHDASLKRPTSPGKDSSTDDSADGNMLEQLTPPPRAFMGGDVKFGNRFSDDDIADSDDDEEKWQLVGSKRKLPTTTPSGPFKNSADVAGVLGGFYTAEDGARASELLNKMYDANLVTPKSIRKSSAKNFNAGSSEMRKIIIDIVLSDPSRRLTRPDRVAQFEKYLREAGVDYKVESPQKRVGTRKKNPRP